MAAVNCCDSGSSVMINDLDRRRGHALTAFAVDEAAARNAQDALRRLVSYEPEDDFTALDTSPT